MAKSKKGRSVDTASEERNLHEANVQKTDTTEMGEFVRILFRGKCPKLSPRGMGDLEYELGINDSTGEICIRIAGNASSGAFTAKWIDLEDIRNLMEKAGDSSFKAVILQPLYKGQSSNNHGYLCAILKAEGVLIVLPDQLTSLKKGEWDTLLKKIHSLKDTGVSLPDHFAMTEKEKAKTRQENKSGENDSEG